MTWGVVCDLGSGVWPGVWFVIVIVWHAMVCGLWGCRGEGDNIRGSGGGGGNDGATLQMHETFIALCASIRTLTE